MNVTQHINVKPLQHEGLCLFVTIPTQGRSKHKCCMAFYSCAHADHMMSSRSKKLTLQFRFRRINIVHDNREREILLMIHCIMVPLKDFVHKLVGEDTETQMCVKPNQ